MKVIQNKIFQFVFTFFLLIPFIGICHETISSSLELRKENEIIHCFFKTPLNTNNSDIQIKFPDNWSEISSSSNLNEKEKTYDYQYVFRISDEILPIKIIRSGEHQSPLIISVISSFGTQTDVLKPDVTEWILPFGSNDSMSTFSSFTFLGIEHILIGFDHLLFVLALLFLIKRKKLIWAISAFTVAHSITLTASTFSLIKLPIALVEALIAFSVVLLAVEMIKTKDKQITKNYIQMAFLFGLLHGFGFASVLSELGVPGNNITLALLAFNVGVEIGQLVFVTVILSSLYLFFRHKSIALISKKLSYPIGGLAAFWFIERVVDIF